MAKTPAGRASQADTLASTLTDAITTAFEPIGKLISNSQIAASWAFNSAKSIFSKSPPAPQQAAIATPKETDKKTPSPPMATLSPTSAASSVISGFGKSAAAALTPLTPAIDLFKTAASGAVQQIYSFVSKANPAVAFEFDRALDDLAGTMGQILTPILEATSGFVRQFADTLQGLRPAPEPIMQSIGAIIGELGRVLEPLTQMMAPVYELIGGVLTSVVIPALHKFVDVLVGVTHAAMDMIEELSFGLIKFSRTERGSSVGAAVRPASYSRIEDIGKRTTLAALNVGRSTLTPDGTAITQRQDKGLSLLSDLKNYITGAGSFRNTGQNSMAAGMTAAIEAAMKAQDA